MNVRPIQSTDCHSNTSDDDLPARVRLLYSSTIEDSDLNSDLRAEFKRLLSRHASTFASSTSDIGFCSLLQHDIDSQDAKPIKQSPRRPPIGACQAEDDILNEEAAEYRRDMV